MDYWFTSDQHFYHNNIIKLCNRPFPNVTEMNEVLIENHNAVVKDEDYVVFNGDFSWASLGLTVEILKRLKGKIHYVMGNHDKVMKKAEIQCYLESCGDLHEMYVPDETIPGKKQFICNMHYAMRVWNKKHYGSWNIYAHSHGGLPEDDSLSIDIGVDAIALRYAINNILHPKNYRPMNYDEIKYIMKAKQK